MGVSDLRGTGAVHARRGHSGQQEQSPVHNPVHRGQGLPWVSSSEPAPSCGVASAAQAARPQPSSCLCLLQSLHALTRSAACRLLRVVAWVINGLELLVENARWESSGTG